MNFFLERNIHFISYPCVFPRTSPKTSTREICFCDSYSELTCERSSYLQCRHEMSVLALMLEIKNIRQSTRRSASTYFWSHNLHQWQLYRRYHKYVKILREQELIFFRPCFASYCMRIQHPLPTGVLQPGTTSDTFRRCSFSLPTYSMYLI